MKNLKPCPFCGSEKLKIDRKSKAAGYDGLDQRVEYHTYSVRCNKCHARGGAVGGKVIPHFTLFYMGEVPLPEWATTDDILIHKAAKNWNGRAENAPTIDAVPVVHGTWIDLRKDDADFEIECSACGETLGLGDERQTPSEVGLNYCPNCGAKMDLEG